MNRYFKIGEFTFMIDMPDVSIPSNFLLFEVNECNYDYKYTLSIVDTLPDITRKEIASREDLHVYKEDELESRLIGKKGYQMFYAVYEEVSSNEANIYYLNSEVEELVYDTLFNSLLALEKRMLKYDSLILHSAYMKYKDEAILFSAPSGVGKSTQANLWVKYRGSEVINGDRSLLNKRDGKWYANAWPVCGSSEICKHIDTPIKCIVMLGQAKVNKAKRLSGMQAFTKLYSQITVSNWDKEAKTRVMDLIEAFVREVPVYYLECDISEEAVSTLQQTIYD